MATGRATPCSLIRSAYVAVERGPTSDGICAVSGCKCIRYEEQPVLSVEGFEGGLTEVDQIILRGLGVKL